MTEHTRMKAREDEPSPPLLRLLPIQVLNNLRRRSVREHLRLRSCEVTYWLPLERTSFVTHYSPEAHPSSSG
jgi:hypothetical protein